MKIKCLRNVAVALAGTMILTGCSANNGQEAKPGEESSETPKQSATADVKETHTPFPEESAPGQQEDDGIITVGYAQVGHESAWRMAATNCAQETFSKERGYELYFVDADNDPDVQKESVQEFIDQNMEYIIIDPIVTDGWEEVLENAKAKNIPVFLIDRTIECDDSLYEAWFGSDFEAEGEAAGAWLEAYLANTGREIDDINIVTIAGTIGSAAQKGRSKGFGRYVDKNANWTRLEERDGMFTEEDGKKVMQKFIGSYEKIDVVVCQNDNEAWGAMEALDEANISYGVGGDVIIISFDAVHDGLKKVLDGKVNADFECNPLSAPYVSDAILAMEKGEKVKQKINYIDEACFQAEDIVGTIDFGEKSKTMITVTEKVLESRAY